jgi:serine protease DegS
MPVHRFLPPILAAAIGAAVATPLAFWLGGRHTAQTLGSAPEAGSRHPAATVDSYAAAVARAAPSVVNIFSSRVTTERQSLGFRDPLMQRLFGNRLGAPPRHPIETSLGSGVVVTDAGHILTNDHIIRQAVDIQVLLADGTDVAVEVVGRDPDTDLAVLKLVSGEAPAIPLGQPRQLQVGDVVLAIGNPFGIGQTVTMGVVGATGRSHLGISAVENFIQTDAAINPGNSGGALINTHGELIGINTAIYSNSGGSHGVGFAIPVDLAENVFRALIRQGRVVRGWLGISTRELNPGLVKSFGLRTQEGLLVSATVENSPAATAGLRPGDVITEINGARIGAIQDLQDAVAQAGPNALLKIAGWRGSDRLNLSTTTVERALPPD